MTQTIADFPAYRIYRPYDGRRFSHGEKIAIPYEARSHGTLYNFFRLGTVAGYAIQNGDDPIEAIENANANGHELYWANGCATVIHSGQKTKEEVPGFEIGDSIILQGKTFVIAKAPNNNIKLVEVK